MMVDEEKKTLKRSKRCNRPRKQSFQKIAKERIVELFEQADLFQKINLKYSNNCMRLARKISLRYKVSFTKEQKIKFCKKCQTYLIPTKTARLRVREGKIIILCNNCKYISRHIYK